MTTNRTSSRRQFISRVGAAALVAPMFASRVVRAHRAANDRIQLGFIGVGMMGRGHLGQFLSYDDVQVVAICEVEGQRRENARETVEKRYAETRKGEYKGCATYVDFRELLARSDIDAVVIATPDHWHAIQCLHAAKAKKDIYCEKPLTHTIHEGRKIVEAVRAAGVVFQTGSQQRSEYDGKFRTAVEWVRNGRIGQVKTIHVGVGEAAVPCDLPEETPPDNLDWDLWLGPAPKRGYSEVLCPKGVHGHYPAFRKYREFAGGGLADMGAHHFDIAQWGLDMDNSGPTRIEPPPPPLTAGLKMIYANGVELFHGGPNGCTFEGTAGRVYVDRDELDPEPESIQEKPLGDQDQRVYLANDHRRNWVECIRGRRTPICDAETGQRSATICHLANIGYWLRRPLTWDPAREQFVGDDEANRLLLRAPRAPWTYL